MDIDIFLSGITSDGYSTVTASGYAVLSDTGAVIHWSATYDHADLAATKNAAMKAAAIAAALDAGYGVGMLNKKTLYGTAVGL